jgi:hypothetical protein
LIEAVAVVAMQALHHSKVIAQLELLQANWALLPSVENVMRVAPFHSRQAIYLLYRHPILLHNLWEERTLVVGLLDAKLIDHGILAVG